MILHANGGDHEKLVTDIPWKLVQSKRTCFTDKKLSYRRGTARCIVSIEILPIATQQCRNYLYDKSWPNRWYEVGDLVGGNALTTPLSGKIFLWQGGTCYGKSMYQIWSLKVHPLRSCEYRCKMQKMGWFGVVRGHPRSSAMSPFDRAHTTLYSTLIETMCLPFSRYSRLFVESRRFWPPHLHSAP